MQNARATRSGRLRAALAGASSRTSDHHSGAGLLYKRDGGVCFAPKSGHVGRRAARSRRGPTTASRTATVSCSIAGELPTGRAEIPFIAMGSNCAVGGHPSFIIQILSIVARLTR
jgi:hypothetical protein